MTEQKKCECEGLPEGRPVNVPCLNCGLPIALPTLSSLIEEQGREFDRVVDEWADDPKSDESIIPTIKSFLASSNRAVIERVVEMIGERISWIHRAQVGTGERQSGALEALSDLRARLLEEMK